MNNDGEKARRACGQVQIANIRRNHGLEHAVLHILSRRFPQTPFAGHSDMKGFWLAGKVSTDDLSDAVQEAFGRLRQGESALAVHPNCGTNFVAAGSIAGGAALLALLGVGPRRRDKMERLPLAAALATLALIVAQPLGVWLQASVTTSPDLGALSKLEILPVMQGKITLHRVNTQYSR